MTQHKVKEYVRKAERVQAMQFTGWSINLEQITAWIGSLGASWRIEHNRYIEIITDSTSYHLKLGDMVVALGPYQLECYTAFDFQQKFDEVPEVWNPKCQKPSDFSGHCDISAHYFFTLDNGQKTYRCKSHMAMNLTRMELSNAELQTIQKL
jgi:hypothetical protein